MVTWNHYVYMLTVHFFHFCFFSPRRYNFHYPKKTEAHLSSLVSPYNSITLFMVFVQGHGSWWRLVYDHELRSARSNVFILCLACSWLQGITKIRHADHVIPDHSNAHWLRSELSGLLMDAARTVSISRTKHCVVLHHVPQLLCALLSLLLRSIYHQNQENCQG